MSIRLKWELWVRGWVVDLDVDGTTGDDSDRDKVGQPRASGGHWRSACKEWVRLNGLVASTRNPKDLESSEGVRGGRVVVSALVPFSSSFRHC